MAYTPPGQPKDLGPLLGAIDQGTSSTRFFVFSANTAELVTFHQVPTSTLSPRQGWLEQDPTELLATVKKCIEVTVANLVQLEVDPVDIVAVGITNQRETTVVWDKVTGRPLSNAILWSDTRTQPIVDVRTSKMPSSSRALLVSFSEISGEASANTGEQVSPPIVERAPDLDILFRTQDPLAVGK